MDLWKNKNNENENVLICCDMCRMNQVNV
jgi:hypothetical protein